MKVSAGGGGLCLPREGGGAKDEKGETARREKRSI